jgi:hypothetical protein
MGKKIEIHHSSSEARKIQARERRRAFEEEGVRRKKNEGRKTN